MAARRLLAESPKSRQTAIVDHDNFMRNSVEVQFQMQVLDGRRDRLLLVARGNDDR